MKNTTWLSILLLISLFFIQNVHSQCSQSSYSFSTQQEVDNFPMVHPTCTDVTGNLLIQSNSDITNLDSFRQLIRVANRISIRGNNELRNLNGLRNIISCDDLEISNNANLTNADGVANIQEVNGSIIFVNNPRIQTFIGLNVPDQIDKAIVADNDSIFYLNAFNDATDINDIVAIRNNPRLSSLDICKSTKSTGNIIIEGLDRLVDFNGFDSLIVADTIRIIDNDQLTLLPYLDQLESIKGQLILSDNDTLNIINRLESLSSIEHGMLISGNRNLTAFTNTDLLQTVGERIEILHNSKLQLIDGLESVEANIMDTLLIMDNDSLAACGIQFVCDYIRDESKYHQISNNKYGCNSTDEVLDWCIVDASINEENPISIFPNPATDILFISNDDKITIDKIEIFNSQGYQVYSQQSALDQILLGHLPRGQYYITIQTEEQFITQSFVK